MRSPHEVLGVRENASRREIREAYRRRARLLHPDSGGTGRVDEMVELNDAYSELSRGHVRITAAPTSPSPVVSVNAPARFPWRFVVSCAIIGSAVVVAGSLIVSPRAAEAPDGVITVGSCVEIFDNLTVGEVECGGTGQLVVRQFVPLDAGCADGSVGYLDRQGMGRACLDE